jgi:ParB-like chromosome segregation protein Spo0J
VKYDKEHRDIIINALADGQGRVRACKAAGIKEIPDTWIKIAESLTEEEQRRFIIEDNIPFWEWDNRLGY